MESHVHSEAGQLRTTEEDSSVTQTKALLCEHRAMPQAQPELPGVAMNTMPLTFLVQAAFASSVDTPRVWLGPSA